MAPSKVFVIPKHTLKPKEEEEEILRLLNNFQTYRRSYWGFLKTRYEEKEKLASTHAQEITEDAEIDRIVALIEKDNAKVREIREAALVIEWKNLEQNIIETRTRLEAERAAEQAQTEILLKAEFERLKTAIPVEGIDEAIEKALATEVDYNFSIDKNGHKYYGRFTKPDPSLERETRRQARRISSS